MSERSTDERIVDDQTQKLMLEQMRQCRAEVGVRLKKAESGSTREVLAVGGKINEIVNTAKTSVEKIQDLSSRNLDTLASLMKDYAHQTELQVETQWHNVECAQDMISQIVNAGKSIRKLAKSARTLTLNAHIMAASLGESGKRVGVLANEMKQHSKEIESRATAIAEVTENLLRTLPKIVDSAQDIRERAKGIGDRLLEAGQDSNESLSASAELANETVSNIVSLAYAALSHLQFHDPHIQNLMAIDTLFYDLLKKIVEVLESDLEVEPPLLVQHQEKDVNSYALTDMEDEIQVATTDVAPDVAPSSSEEEGAQSGDVILF